MRISLTPACARARCDNTATAAAPTDSSKNSRRFIAISRRECRDGARSFDVGMMVLLAMSVECSAKITMTTLLAGSGTMCLLPNHDLERLIFLAAHIVQIC